MSRRDSTMRPLALMLFVSWIGSCPADVPTYKHMDPQTGQMLTCSQCPPGTFMGAHCTPNRDTVCASCPANHFTQFWNYLPNCLYCSNFCVENQHVKEECSAKNNRLCQCNEGYYWHSDFCVKHAECPAGYGVRKKGTVYSDTECEKCPAGAFSAAASPSAQCAEHTDCASLGLEVMLRGSRWHDNVCISCLDLHNDGGLSILKGFLPHFFAHQKIRLSKLKRVVRHFGQRRQPPSPFYSRRDLLLKLFSKWIKDANIDQLKELPRTLQYKNMHRTAEKVSRIFNKLNAINCDRHDV